MVKNLSMKIPVLSFAFLLVAGGGTSTQSSNPRPRWEPKFQNGAKIAAQTGRLVLTFWQTDRNGKCGS